MPSPHDYPRRILLVEPDKPRRSELARLIADAGYRVRPASDCAEAIPEMESWRPDLLLIDAALAADDSSRGLRARAREGRCLLALVQRPDSPEIEEEQTAPRLRLPLDADQLREWVALLLRLQKARLAGEARDATARRPTQEDDDGFALQHLDHTPLGRLQLDSEYRILAWSRRSEELFGWTAEEALGKTPHQLGIIHPEDLSTVNTRLDRLRTKQQSSSVGISRNLAKDGRVLHCEWYNSAQFDSQGRLLGIFALAQDVTERVAVERAAQELSDRLEATLERITDALFTVDLDWQITYLNSETERLLRRRRHDLLGRRLWDEFPGETSAGFRRHYEQAMASQKVVTFEEYYKPLGLWFEVRAYPSLSGLSVYFHDITERRRAQSRLRQREQALAALMDNLPGIVVLLSAEGRMLRWNRRLEERLGRSPQWLAEANALSLIAPRHRAAARDGIADAFRLGKAQAELEALSASGELLTYFFTARAIEVDGAPCALAVGVDITEQKRAEQRVHEQAALLDMARDAIMVHDLEHRILYWNRSAERLFGWSEAEAMGRSARALFDGAATGYDQARSQALSQGESIAELKLQNPSGASLTIEARWTLLRNVRKKPYRFLVIITDVTEQRQLEQQFLRAQRLESIGTLASGIAHDLNNVLAPIILSIDLLKQSAAHPDTEAILESVGQAAQRGADMVRQVLSFARGMEGRRVEVQLRHLLREVRAIVRGTFPKNIAVHLELANDLRTVLGDPTQLHQVLLNLCVNARDAMPNGGELVLNAGNVRLDESSLSSLPEAKPGPYVRLEVRDSGCGMEPDVLEKIFDPFFTTKEFGSGTGLGLSTSLSIVKGHGGFLRVHSEPGVGSRFGIYLPALERRKPPDEADPRLPASCGQGQAVLVADDEAALREAARQTLESFGYRAITASNGAEALARFEERRSALDAIVLDMMMPVLDGSTAIQELRRRAPDLPIIASSGVDSPERERQAIEAGATRFLPKPYSADSLLGLLSELLAQPSRQ